jgi:hypothetical protein
VPDDRAQAGYFDHSDERQQMSGTVYRGHVLRVQIEGPGFAVYVRPCTSPFALNDPMPYDLDEKAAMNKAEQLVDAVIARRVATLS